MLILLVFIFHYTVASFCEFSFHYKLHFQTLCAASVQFIRRKKAGDKTEMPMPIYNFSIVKVLWEDFQGLAQFSLKSVGGFPFLSTGKETNFDACSFKRLLWSFFFFLLTFWIFYTHQLTGTPIAFIVFVGQHPEERSWYAVSPDILPWAWIYSKLENISAECCIEGPVSGSSWHSSVVSLLSVSSFKRSDYFFKKSTARIFLRSCKQHRSIVCYYSCCSYD